MPPHLLQLVCENLDLLLILVLLLRVLWLHTQKKKWCHKFRNSFNAVMLCHSPLLLAHLLCLSLQRLQVVLYGLQLLLKLRAFTVVLLFGLKNSMIVMNQRCIQV